jgi:hypothetical protein
MLTVAIQPQPPLAAHSDLSEASLDLSPVQRDPGERSAWLTVTLRTNATIAPAAALSSAINLSGKPEYIVLRLAPVSDYNPSEQVKIEVLAEGQSENALNTWTLGAIGLPPAPQLQAGAHMEVRVLLKPTGQAPSDTIKVYLTVNWANTGQIPGDLRPSVAR